jgi:hypothetical protein
MNCMDNPYQSPKSIPEVEKRPVKPPGRYVSAVLRGSGTWLGLVFSLTIIMLCVWEKLDMQPSGAERRLSVLVCALIACPVGMSIAWWTWKAPDSKWARVTAKLLGLSPLALLMFLMLYFIASYLLS